MLLNHHSPERQLIELRMEHADLNAAVDRLAADSARDLKQVPGVLKLDVEGYEAPLAFEITATAGDVPASATPIAAAPDSGNGTGGIWRTAALALAENFALKPRDVVYIDPVPLVQWNRIISLILPSAQVLYTGRQISTP